MAIKINSINIRRFYTEEELAIANKIREHQRNIEDIKMLEMLSILSQSGCQLNEDVQSLTWEEFQEYLTSEKFEQPEIRYRDSKKVETIQSFISKNSKQENKDSLNEFSRNNEELKEFRKNIKDLTKDLKIALYENKSIRVLTNLYNSDIVGLSVSALTDSLFIKDDEESDLIIIVTADQEDMMRDLIRDGFFYNGQKYILYSASAGQLRKKKIMFIQEQALNIAMPKLTNGLSIEEINKRGGVNINKWSAYQALSTSSTNIWQEIDLDRVCVVDDFETILKDRLVDHINDDYEISRVKKDVTIAHTDGFGMMHPKFCRDTRMIRAPWIKGLVAPMDYRSFSNTFDGKKILTDVWGDTYDIGEIDLILTKSQFKMWKYYDSWQHYKDNFKINGCEFRYMIPESKKDLRLNAMLNYQMWNTLDIADKEKFAVDILGKDLELLECAHYEVGAMLNMFHVDKEYQRNNNLQKALYLYPQILQNEGFKKMLKDNIVARKKELRQGRIKVNGVYTFIIPDVFAWCEHLFLDIENPNGILKDGEVSCKLVEKDKDIAVNRSPHLYKEWCIRKNVKDKEQIRWFIGKGVYTSVHDMISKQLFFDVDGDIALVIDNDKIVNIAKETMKDIVPLDFRLEKAPSETISWENIYSSYNLAFTANIGYYSNLITKVMNSKDRDIELVAKICWINNQVIDFAKTKWKVEPTEELANRLEELDKQKLPYFFIWAKDKDKNSVEPPSKYSVVDQMAVAVDKVSNRIRFNYNCIEELDINIMLSNVNIQMDEGLINNFKRVANAKYQAMIKKKSEEDETYVDMYINNHIRNDMYNYCLNNNIDIEDAVDICIKHVFENNRERDVLFTVFGDIIVDRLEQRFPEALESKYYRCDYCGKHFEKNTNNINTCESCSKRRADRIKNRQATLKNKENKTEKPSKNEEK